MSTAQKKVWKLRKADPEALQAWMDAHKKGVEAFHSDPVKHAAWCKKISDAHILLWRDPDWVLSRNRSYYAVRPLPEASSMGLHLFLAGWDGRTVSFLAGVGIPLSEQNCDDTTPRALRGVGNTDYHRASIAPVKYARGTPTAGGLWFSRYHPDHEFLVTSISVFEALGVPVDRLRGGGGGGGGDGGGGGSGGGSSSSTTTTITTSTTTTTTQTILGETKCVKGQACRGEMGKDKRKWLAASETCLRLVIFSWYMDGMVLGTVNKKSEIASGKSCLVQVHSTFAFSREHDACLDKAWLQQYHKRALNKLCKYSKSKAAWEAVAEQEQELTKEFGKQMKWYSHRLYENVNQATVICLGKGDKGVVVDPNQTKVLSLSLDALPLDVKESGQYRVVAFCFVHADGTASPFPFPKNPTEEESIWPRLDGKRAQSFADGKQKKLKRKEVKEMIAAAKETEGADATEEEINETSEDDKDNYLLDNLEDAYENSYIEQVEVNGEDLQEEEDHSPSTGKKAAAVAMDVDDDDDDYYYY